MITIATKIWPIAVLSALILLFDAKTPIAQDDSTRVAYYIGKSVRRHPDGAVGSVTFHILGQYRHVSSAEGAPSTHQQKYHFGLGWVASDYANFAARFLVVNEESLHYELSGLLTLYSRNPVTTNRKKNADGAVGAPVVTLGAGLRYDDFAIKDKRFVGDFSLLLPVSERLSFLAGYRQYEEIQTDDVVQGYAGINLYLAGYSRDSAYTNPDGPIGMMAFHLTGGASSEGTFGDLTFMFPISENLTWKIQFRGERVYESDLRITVVGAGLSFYPAN